MARGTGKRWHDGTSADRTDDAQESSSSALANTSTKASTNALADASTKTATGAGTTTDTRTQGRPWQDPAPLPPQAARAFAARQLLAELQRGPASTRSDGLAAQLTSTSVDLLHWWCASSIAQARPENFNIAQRDALLQLVLMHERHDDAPLHGDVCLAPGAGLRWLAQAVLIWQWANHAAARGRDALDSRFDDRIAVSTDDNDDDPALLQHLCDSILRHARLFLPPLMRVPFQWWVAARTRRFGPAGTRASAHRKTTLRLRTASGLDLRFVDVAHDDAPVLHALTPAHAMRLGVIKLPMLEPPADGRAPPLRARIAGASGARPRLRRGDAALLDRGLACLHEREAAFVALDPARRPRMRVLCDTRAQARAARRHLRLRGVDVAEIACSPRDASAQHARIAIACADVHAADAQTCVLVRLRTHAPADSAPELRALCLPLLWPEPAFASLRAANRERAVAGRTPTDLIDVLSVIDHPRMHEHYLPLFRYGSAAWRRDSRPIAATGDALRVDLREDAAAFDFGVPPPCVDLAPFDDGERLGDVARLYLRRSASLPSRKSIYPRLGWEAQDGGLRCALVEMAEADPWIERHCLLDPRLHADRHRDLLLALGCDARGLIHAVAATRHRIYLIELQPYGASAPRASTPAERALRRWCRHVNALPADARDHRQWRWVRLPAPLFWSSKRAGTALSALLAALGDTRTLLPRPQRAPSPTCD